MSEFDFLLKHQNIDSEDLSVSFHDFEHLTASKEPFWKDRFDPKIERSSMSSRVF